MKKFLYLLIFFAFYINNAQKNPYSQILTIYENGAVSLKYDADKDTLTKITIPTTIEGTTITSIAERGFDRCSYLIKVVIPNGVISIGEEAFQECKSLKDISIPSSVTKISDWAFNHCESLKNISIPSSVRRIGNEAFYNCENLKVKMLSTQPPEIGESTFDVLLIEVPKSSLKFYKRAWSNFADIIVGY